MKSLVLILAFANISMAGELKVFHINVKDGIFSPSSIQIPAGEKVQLEVQNTGVSTEEFESVDLNREKVVSPGQTIKLFIGPLAKGEYKFFGDFHKDTAHGLIIVQ